jgi:dihydropteroate synthase
MQVDPNYEEVSLDIIKYLSERVSSLNQMGINDVIVDPGFGFGKSLEQNYKLLKDLSLFNMMECPILVGLSRKSMLYKLLKITPENALNATTAANTLALVNGADILRVHDVWAAIETIKMLDLYRKS